ncbi:MAG: gluconolactonase [Phenylobacterium sp.]|nr:gluconolactonase [Phenylobacterium sp.]
MQGVSAQALSGLIAQDATFEAMPGGADIGGGDTAGWGRGLDGPLWVAELDALAFCDIAHARRLLWTSAGEILILHEDTGGAVVTGRDSDGGFIAGEWAGRRVSRIAPDGAREVLADRFEGRRLNTPHEVLVAPDGAIYFTDVRAAFPPPDPDAVPASGLYRRPANGGPLERIETGLAEPRGLALAPDGRRLYVSEPASRRLVAIDLGPDAEPGPPRRLATLSGDGEGAPHGLCVDERGVIFCGGPGGLWAVAPDGEARLLAPLAASRVTNLAFGGADGRRLYLTTPVGVGWIATLTRAPAAPVTSPVRLAARRRPKLQQAIERWDPALDRVLDPDAAIANLASGGFFEDLGGGPDELYSRSLEGVIWSAEEDCLFFSDIGNSRRMRWTPDGRLSIAHKPTGHTNGATLDLQGRIVQCEHSGRRISRRERDGSVTTLVDNWRGKRLNHPNDVVVRSDGSIYFTDPWWDFGAGETTEIGHPAVFHVTPDLETVNLVARDYRVPNGLAFSPDETVLYVNDSYGVDAGHGPHIRAYDVRPDGSVDAASARVFCRLAGEGEGKPDGMKVDQAGNVYCGGAGGLWIIDPTGKPLGRIRHGATQTNNLAFGGRDGKTLFFVTWMSLHAIPVLIPGAPVPARRT